MTPAPNFSYIIGAARRRATGGGGTPTGWLLPPKMPESQYISEGTSGAHSIVVPLNGDIGAAIDTALAGAGAGKGWVIYLRGGSWTGKRIIAHKHVFSPTLSLDNIDQANPITIMSYPGETANFVGNPYSTTTSIQQENALKFADCTGFRFRNITVSCRNHPGFKNENNYYFEWDHCNFWDVGRDMPCTGNLTTVPQCSWGISLGTTGQIISGYTNTKSFHHVVTGCMFKNNGGNSWGGQGDIKHGHATYLGASNNSSTAGLGLDTFLYENNIVFDNWAGNAAQFGDSAYNGFVVNNTVCNTDTRGIHANGTLATDFSGAALDFWSASGATITGNIKVKNNILCHSVGATIYGSCSQDQQGIEVDYNCLFHNGYANDWGGQELTVAGQNRYGAFKLFDVGTHNVIGDPKFVDAPIDFPDTGRWGDTTKNFALQSGSAAIGMADPAYAPAKDRNGVSRSSLVCDAGAVAFSTGGSPAPPPPPAGTAVTRRGIGSPTPPNAASATAVVAKPTGVVVGDLMIAWVAVAASDAGLICTAPAGWTALTPIISSGDGGQSLFRFHKLAASGDPATWNFTFSGGTAAQYQNQTFCLAYYDPSGNTLTVLEEHGRSDVGDHTVVTDTVVPDVAGQAILASFAIDESTTPPYSFSVNTSGFTEVLDRTESGTNLMLGVYERLDAPLSAQAVSVTNSGTRGGAAGIMRIGQGTTPGGGGGGGGGGAPGTSWNSFCLRNPIVSDIATILGPQMSASATVGALEADGGYFGDPYGSNSTSGWIDNPDEFNNTFPTFTFLQLNAVTVRDQGRKAFGNTASNDGDACVGIEDMSLAGSRSNQNFRAMHIEIGIGWGHTSDSRYGGVLIPPADGWTTLPPVSDSGQWPAQYNFPPAGTVIDVQGLLYWDPGHNADAFHFYSGWEFHPVTAWRIHV